MESAKKFASQELTALRACVEQGERLAELIKNTSVYPATDMDEHHWEEMLALAATILAEKERNK